MNTVIILVTINIGVWFALAWCAVFQGVDYSGVDHSGVDHSPDRRGTLDRKASTIGDGT
ncbi:MAG: hypothetical protein IIC71_13410 [Acidobacteria bacterium]|nr:hypothetical protein [Acidobacteriota bacterium]